MQFEPELFPGLIYRVKQPKAVLLVFVTGKVVITGQPPAEILRLCNFSAHAIMLTHAQYSGCRSAADVKAAFDQVLEKIKPFRKGNNAPPVPALPTSGSTQAALALPVSLSCSRHCHIYINRGTGGCAGAAVSANWHRLQAWGSTAVFASDGRCWLIFAVLSYVCVLVLYWSQLRTCRNGWSRFCSQAFVNRASAPNPGTYLGAPRSCAVVYV